MCYLKGKNDKNILKCGATLLNIWCKIVLYGARFVLSLKIVVLFALNIRQMWEVIDILPKSRIEINEKLIENHDISFF